MKLVCNLSILVRNRKIIERWGRTNNINVSYMIKKQFIKKEIINEIEGRKIYTTAEHSKFIDISKVVVIDAFDKRDGISIEEARKKKNKEVAVINFFCCEEKKPKVEDLKRIVKEVRGIGYKTISFGGSMMLDYDYYGYDEIRIGEALMTGYSTVEDRYFKGLDNPFSIRTIDYKSDGDRIILKHGFLEIGGFTNAKTICVNTDITIIDNKEEDKEYGGHGRLILKPDYYTLMKLAHNGEFRNVEFIR